MRELRLVRSLLGGRPRARGDAISAGSSDREISRGTIKTVMGKLREYVVSGRDPHEGCFAVVASTEGELREWLDNKYILGIPRIRDAIIADLRGQGSSSYDSEYAQEDYELTDDEAGDLHEIQFEVFVRTIELTKPEDILQALHEINVHRAREGQRPLDPVAAGWSPDDVLKEADRLRRVPNLRRSLLR